PAMGRECLALTPMRAEHICVFVIECLREGDSPPAIIVIPAHRALHILPLIESGLDHLARAHVRCGVADDVFQQGVENITDLPTVARFLKEWKTSPLFRPDI